MSAPSSGTKTLAWCVNPKRKESSFAREHTDLIKLDGVELCAHLAQSLFRRSTIRAIRLAEDSWDTSR